MGIGSGRWSHRPEPTAWLESLLGTTAIGIIRTWLITSVLSLSFASLSQAATTTFIARGNEPNWRVEVTDATVTFQAMGADAVTISPKPEATVVADAETYLAMVEGEPFSLTVTDKICIDTMSGMTYPKTVAVNLGEKTYSGCGGDPATLLRGEWLIEEIGGKAIIAKSQPTISFGDDGQISGNGSCNRYFGPYALSGEGLKISDLASSMMACEQPLMDQEALLIKSLHEASRFEIKAGGVLVLLGSDRVSVLARRE